MQKKHGVYSDRQVLQNSRTGQFSQSPHDTIHGRYLGSGRLMEGT